MEEILASIRRIIEDSDPGQAQGAKSVANDHPVAPSGPEVPAVPPERAQPAAPQMLQQPPRPGNVVARPASQELKKEGQAAEPLIPNGTAKENPVEPVATFTQAARKPESERRPAEGARPASLIAEQTSRQVAAVFNELSVAVEDSRRRGFEKMAEEMMRPMLKEWLDRNLPALVERLVREEIRRITETDEAAA